MKNPLVEYFQEQISKSCSEQNLEFSNNVKNYLINLMVRAAKANEIISSEEIYLFDLYQKSLEAESKQKKFETLKFLGDYSLVMVSCFSEYVEKKPVGLDYYVQMGKTAYLKGSSLCQSPALFEELSFKYGECVSVLNEVSEQGKNYTSKDIGRLYGLWLSTRSTSIERKLIRQGVVLTNIEG